jgi:hypothetical protein
MQIGLEHHGRILRCTVIRFRSCSAGTEYEQRMDVPRCDLSKTTRQNMIDGKTFISGEEAASLSVAFTNKCIELKIGILDLVDGATPLALSLLSAPEHFDVNSFSDEIFQLAWKGIFVSKNIDAIAPAARAMSSKSAIALTWQNIRNGNRLTRR